MSRHLTFLYWPYLSYLEDRNYRTVTKLAVVNCKHVCVSMVDTKISRKMIARQAMIFYNDRMGTLNMFQ